MGYVISRLIYFHKLQSETKAISPSNKCIKVVYSTLNIDIFTSYGYSLCTITSKSTVTYDLTGYESKNIIVKISGLDLGQKDIHFLGSGYKIYSSQN